MQVKATRRGFYGSLREPGDEFELADEKHMGSWMVPVLPEDQKRLADRMKQLGVHVRAPAPPNVPPTTGPGYRNAVTLQAIAPKPVVAKEPKQGKPDKPA
jgi:hypothetical protein